MEPLHVAETQQPDGKSWPGQRRKAAIRCSIAIALGTAVGMIGFFCIQALTSKHAIADDGVAIAKLLAQRPLPLRAPSRSTSQLAIMPPFFNRGSDPKEPSRGGRARMYGLMDMLSGKEPEMIDPKDALPGRKTPMPVSEKHYVLGNPMRGPWPKGFQTIIFGNGCFWGSEKGIWRLPGGGVYSTAVGYAGGFSPNPTYEEACSGRTGHTEAVQVVFDPSKISIVDILRWFWEAHDPTSGNGQGNDRGTQYRSGLYYFDDDQKKLFEASKTAYEKALKAQGKGMGDHITTEIKAVADCPDGECFYYGEDYHQQYLAKPMARPYCSAKPQGISLPPFEEWAPADLKDKYKPTLSEKFWTEHGPKAGCSVVNSPNEVIRWQD